MRASKNRSALVASAFAIAGLGAAPPAARADLIQVDTKMKPSDAAWTPRPTQVLPRLEGYAPKGPRPLSRYGGLAGSGEAGTGFFAARKLGDRWWLPEPDG